MSVCFFVPANQAGSSTAEDNLEHEGGAEDSSDTPEQGLQQFWAKVMDDIRKVTAEDFKTQALPLARIKKIMKLDDEVKMIAAEAPVLFAKATEIFIQELTMRAWYHAQDKKRKTLQRNDIAMAISKSDQFDFLIDIVPRQEVKPLAKPHEELPRHAPEQMVQQQQTMQASSQQQFVVQPCAQLVQQSSSGAAAGAAQQAVTLVQQLVTPAGEVQQLPLQLTQAQLNMIRLQVQSNPSQPIIIQAQPQASPQIIQVSSQAQHQPQQQVFLAQVATSHEDS